MDSREHILIEDSQEEITRVDDLWFPDANLVLQAGNRLFRVFGGILAARSTVFRDMLSIPQPNSQPLIDGCPAVVLHDAPADVEYLLKAIFDSGFFERPPAPATFNVVAGVLRLSTKYDVEYLRTRALLHLSAALPRSLAEYDLRGHVTPFHTETNVTFPLLLLVHELALAWALPTALYFAALSTVKRIMDGFSSNGHNIELPRSLQRTLLIGRNTLVVAQTYHILRCFRTLPCDGCLRRESCQVTSRVLYEAVAGLQLLSPLNLFSPEAWNSITSRLCAPCSLAMGQEYQTARQKVWDELPGTFELGSWEELGPAPV
ncbi:hypothetical protein MSAN_02069500 [Mycena sanguinolenta]|uniref:BTB domain-containing protein n=1 Tax=Mycena sanguinolenta TaxID=230812 RepID=A0A8H7CMR0_9AGAR|nr:hypothetical protein MSAN_02069500 [Mycena sanguinolenta]